VNTKYYKSAILTQNTPVTKHVGFGNINGNAWRYIENRYWTSLICQTFGQFQGH